MTTIDDILLNDNSRVKEIINDIGQILSAREKKALSILTVRQLSRYYDKLAQGVPKEEAFEELKTTSERLLSEREALAKQLEAEYEKAWLWIKGQRLRMEERKDKQAEEIEKRRIFLQTNEQLAKTNETKQLEADDAWENQKENFKVIQRTEPEHWTSFEEDFQSYRETLRVYDQHIESKLALARPYMAQFEKQIIEQTKQIESILEDQIIPLENKIKDSTNERDVRRWKKDKSDLYDYYHTELEKLKAAENKSRVLLTSTKEALREMNAQDKVIKEACEAAKKRYEHFVEQFKLFVEQKDEETSPAMDAEDDLPPTDDDLPPEEDDLLIDDDLPPDDDDDLPPDDDDLPPEDDDDLPPEDNDLPPDDISSTMSEGFFNDDDEESSEEGFTDFSDVNEDALLANLPSDELEEELPPFSDEGEEEGEDTPQANENEETAPSNEQLMKQGQFNFNNDSILRKYSFPVIKFGRRVRKKKRRVWSIDIPNQRVVTSSQVSKRACKIIPAHDLVRAVPDVVHHQLVNVQIKVKKKLVKAALYFNSAAEREMFLQAICALKGLPLYSSFVTNKNILVQGYEAANVQMKKLKGSPFGKFAQKRTMSSIPVSHTPYKNMHTFVGLWNPAEHGELPTNPVEIREMWMGPIPYECVVISIVNLESMNMAEFQAYFQSMVGDDYICVCSSSYTGMHTIVFLMHLSLNIMSNVFTNQVVVPQMPNAKALMTSIQFYNARVAFITSTCENLEQFKSLYPLVMSTKIPNNSKLMTITHDHVIWSAFVPSTIHLEPKDVQKLSMKLDQIPELRNFDELQQQCDKHQLLWGFFEPDIQGFPSCTTPPSFNSRILTYSKDACPIHYNNYTTTRKTCNSVHRFLKADIQVPCCLSYLGKLLPDDPLSHFNPSLQFESIDVLHRQSAINRPILDIMSTFTTQRHLQTQPIDATANPSWASSSLPSRIHIHTPSIDYLRTQQLVFNIYDGRHHVAFARFELFNLFEGLSVIPTRDELLTNFEKPIAFALPLVNVSSGLPEGSLEGSFHLVY